MRHLPTFEEFINESEVNELLKIDSQKLDDFLKRISSKIKDSRLLSDIKDFIAMQKIDPYQSYSRVLSDMLIRFRNEKPLLQLIKAEL
jgi:hypothetical protein